MACGELLEWNVKEVEAGLFDDRAIGIANASSSLVVAVPTQVRSMKDRKSENMYRIVHFSSIS